MRRYAVGLSLATVLVAGIPLVVTTQSTQLTVLDAGPRGEINQLQDANEIRVVFSEPMVPLGRVPSNPTPPWIHITPAAPGSYRWSGTTILLFTPDPAAHLAFATRFTVHIDGTATSESGRRLGTPYEFTFTTPTARLSSARWYRRTERFDSPLVIVMQFNQHMRPADVLGHLTVRYQPHDVDLPTYSERERARLAATDPAGLQRFEAKVAAARQTAARTDVVSVQLTSDWDRKRFPESDHQVVVETATPPAPGGWLQITLDDRLPAAEGPEHPPDAQRSSVVLTPVFFAESFSCRQQCDPSDYNPVRFTVSVNVEPFARSLGVRDLTDPAREQTILPTSPVKTTTYDEYEGHAVEDAGYDRQPPAHTWLYRLDPSLQAADGQTLGYPWVGIVENWHERAFTSFGDGHGVWETDGGSLLPFYARNFKDLTQWIAPLTASTLVPRIVALEDNHFQELPPGAGTARTLNVTPDQIQSHGLDLKSVLSPSGTGLVWAGIEPGEPIAQAKRVTHEPKSTIVQVTNLGITVKDSPQSTLIFVTRLDNGAAVADARVSIVNLGNQQLWRGTTGRDGVAMAPALPLRKPDDWYKLSFVVTAEKDGDIGYVASNWNEGITPWEFGVGYQLWEATDILRGSVFSDRGVYKPGEDVHVKAIVRADTVNGIRLLPSGSTLDIRVRDSRNKEVDRRTITINRWSSAEWSWTVPAEATLGSYSIEAMLPGSEKPEGNDVTPRVREGDWLKRVHGSFLVAAYRRPDFRVDATLTADPAIAGAPLHASLDARYLFGNAMPRRPVKWSVTRQPDFGVPAAITERYPDDKYTFGYYPARDIRPDTRVAGDQTTLDAAGKMTIDVPSATGVDFAYRYTFEGDVEDVSRQHIANRASIVVPPAPWYIGLRRPDYFADVAKGTSVDVVAVDRQGHAVPNVPVKLALIHIQWNSVRHAQGGGYYTWETQRVETPSGEWSVTTTATPVRVEIPVPEGGYYELHAVASDADGRSTRTDSWFYGLGKGYTAWERFDHNRITLEPEKKTWKPGDKARVMIQSPWETATALLTVEREGVRRYERFDLTSTQQTVEVPITEEDIPNLYVSVLLIRGRTSKDPGADGSDPGKPTFRLGYAQLSVEDATKKLEVKVSADRAEYRPAGSAKVSIGVTDAAGKAAAGEVTLWAVDYGVLSLTDYSLPDVLHAVYREKALQVMNEDSRQRIISRRVLTPKGASDGGGGGAEAGAANFRRDFRPLAFWLGSVETDATGHAVKDVTLPESLTTYRIMAVAADAASRFGSSSVEIKVNKPITLLAAFPRFLGLGDKASFGAVVTNTLATGGDAVVTIRSLDPAVLQFGARTSQTIRLDAQATEPVRFEAAARGVGTARVQMTVTLGTETDAFEATLPVSAPAPLETSAAFGDTAADRSTERLAVPAGIVPGTGGLEVSLASTALVGLGEGARYLADYPYGCAEQKASSALALALAADLGTAFSMGRIAPADYRVKATSLLAELPRYQCADGGFEYWPGGCLFGNTYLTSYLLHVMKVAAGLGLRSDEEVIQRALDFLDHQMKIAPPVEVQWLPIWSASEAFGVKVLTEYGRNEDANITRLVQMADRLPIFSLSYLADAMAASNARGARYDDVVRRVWNALRIEGDQAHVEEIDTDALDWLWNSNVRASALVLEGFVRRKDDPQFVAPLVRWLLAARKNGRWRNTQENATALESLVGYYKAFETETPDMTASVGVGQTTIGTARFRGRSSTAQSVRVAMPDLVRQVAAGAERDLVLTRAGTGHLYYTARLQFALTDPLPALDQGMRVERRYEKFVETGSSPAETSFAAGDLIRVTLTITLPKERRYVAVTDALPAGVEAVDSWFRTTASDLAKDASASPDDKSWESRYRRGGFDHVEKYDDRVVLFATRLAEGTHEFSYLVRATTAGTFGVSGARAEEMYAPEVTGRSAPVVMTIR
ncbi:MAG TPA: MG2 domain-containing protein [Vicinamibacterales bacterium]|nr:MG2 domain-containing protein [Vicinamibacterales bacterium]